MDYLITGATGFIGQKLVQQLLSTGHEVSYLARKRSSNLDPRAEYHCWNPEEHPPLNSVPTIDAIIHLAGEPVAQRWTSEVKRRIHESRVVGTRRLVAAIGELKHKPSVLVSASAVGYYGDRGDELLTEASHPGSDFLADVCVAWEREAFRAREFGVRVVPIRIAAVLGREGGALKKMLTPFRLGIGGTFGSGRQWMPWIHIDDLIQLFVFASATESLIGAMNGCSPQPVTNAEFTSALARALHRPAVLPIPKFALRLALGEMADFLLSSQKVVPEATLQSGFQFEHPQLAQALKSLLS